MQTGRRCWMAVSVLLLAGGAGCGSGRSKVQLFPVTGRVTLNGLPARAEVVFQPESPEKGTRGRPSTATTRADGTFTLGYAADQHGALGGKHRVTITVSPPEAEPGSKAPPDPAAGKVARFERDVIPGARNDFPFVLSY